MEDTFDHFRVRYERTDAAVLDTIETVVIGAAYGANGYTTRDQADLIGRRLGLAEGHLLLDVGTGCGWPGLYFAATTGCRVVATDVPFEGLVRAARRAGDDDLLDRASVVASTGQQPPFRAGTFDAVCSTDVLC